MYLLARWGLFSYIMTVVIHPQRKLRNHAHKESNPYFTKNYLNSGHSGHYRNDGTATEICFYHSLGRRDKNPGTYREQGC